MKKVLLLIAVALTTTTIIYAQPQSFKSKVDELYNIIQDKFSGFVPGTGAVDFAPAISQMNIVAKDPNFSVYFESYSNDLQTERFALPIVCIANAALSYVGCVRTCVPGTPNPPPTPPVKPCLICDMDFTVAVGACFGFTAQQVLGN